jgi:hypothetical protein
MIFREFIEYTFHFLVEASIKKTTASRDSVRTASVDTKLQQKKLNNLENMQIDDKYCPIARSLNGTSRRGCLSWF